MGSTEVISLLSWVYLMMWAAGLTVINSGVVDTEEEDEGGDGDDDDDDVTGFSVILNWFVSVLYCFRLVSRLGNDFCVVEVVVSNTEVLPNGDEEGSRLLLENLGFKVTESSLGLNDGRAGSDSVDVEASFDLSLPLILILLMDMITGDGLDGGGRDLEV